MPDENKSGRIPNAPYPPFVSKTTGRGRNRSGVAIVGTTSPALSSPAVSTPSHQQGNKPTFKSTITSPSPSLGTPQQLRREEEEQHGNFQHKARQHPGRIEFFNGSVYGAINCLWHKNSCGPSGAFSGNANRKKSTSNFGASSKLGKSGPVLLELRCLNQPPDYDDDDEEDENDSNHLYSWFEGNTIAITRGIASSSIASTCLSFRQSYPKNIIPASSSSEECNAQSNHMNSDTIHCATGLSNGALCIHTIKNLNDYLPHRIGEEDEINHNNCILDSANSEDAKVSYFSHQHTRHNRPVSAVSWRCGSSGSNNVHSNHVAVGYNSSQQGAGGSVSGQRTPPPQRFGNDAYLSGFFAYVWDVAAQSNATKGTKQLPLYKLAPNSSVTSLSWIPESQSLAIGCNQSQHGKNLHIHDLGMSGGPVFSTFAHDNAVHGIEFDPQKSHVFATFSRGLAEPVKLWDARKMDSCLAEIKTHSTQSKLSSSQRELPSFVSGIAWDPCAEGMLTIATGDDLKFYNTRINLSRPVLSRVSHTDGPIQCITYPLKRDDGPLENESLLCSPQRIIAVYNDGKVSDLPTQQVSPVALSCRDGRVANSIGPYVCVGSTTDGPSAMEKATYDPSEDISTTMMRRARCLHVNRYSTDAKVNLQMLNLDQEAFQNTKEASNRDGNHDAHLTSVWSFIERVENLCFRNSLDKFIDEGFWPAKTLLDSGVLTLLRLDVQDIDEVTTFETSPKSEVFNRNIYDSPLRQAALTACGWNKRSGLREVLSKTEQYGHFERSAALACWYGDLGEAVSALQRGATFIRMKLEKGELEESKSHSFCTTQYAETLELVAMCVAGYNSGAEKESLTSKVWKSACQNLLNRPNMIEDQAIGSRSHSNYLRAIVSFLMDDSNLDKTLKDETLNLSDRVAFACIYLPRRELKDYLESCLDDCLKKGNLEGLLITGLNRQGIALLQSYVDVCADIQTVALVSSRVILPLTWEKEKELSSVWLESYREFLNCNQMWQSRALFDVGRVELLRKLRERQQVDEQNLQPNGRMLRRTNNQRRQVLPSSSNIRQQNDNPIPSSPPQIHARCTYCNTSLPLSKLRRQENIANNWLSRQKSVLPCCPNPECRKPLPRCSICLLSLGCLNPYMELRREGNRFPRRGSGQHKGQRGEDLSNLASMPFGDWFAWCAKCNHGGHVCCLKSWFDRYMVCPVSNCNCRCQFDVIRKLKRPALTTKKTIL